MSYENGLNVFEENSGEIKIDSNDVIVDNSSYIIMGHSTEEAVNPYQSVNVFYKQIGGSDNEKPMIFSDIKSVEEWLRNRTDFSASTDLDFSKCDEWLSSSVTESSSYNVNDSIRLHPSSTTSYNDVEETSLSAVNWEDYVLETESYSIGLNPTTILSNNLIVPTSDETTSETEFEAHTVDGILKAPNTGTTILNFESATNSQLKSAIEVGLGLPSELSVVDQPVLGSERNPSNLEKLPFVKVSKNCLAKGKILGKRDKPLLSKDSVFVDKKHIAYDKSKSNFNRPRQSSLLKGKIIPSSPHNIVDVEGKQTVVILPVHSSKNPQKDSLLKVNHPRSLLKINNTPTNCDVVTETFQKEFGNSSNKNGAPDTCPVAVVAISTNKSNDTTEIIIKTEEGENVYKGKTSDIMKATGSTDLPNSNQTGNHQLEKNDDSESIRNLMVNLLGVTDEVLDSIESTVQLQCPVDKCTFVTPKGSWLKVHILQHYGIRPFKCNFPSCTWAFYTKFRLKRHQEAHSKKKDFKCPVEGCGRLFTTTSNLKLHSKLHARPSNILCTVGDCNEAFQTRRGFETHLRKHGVEYAPYTCKHEGCGKKYFTIGTLNAHSRLHQQSQEELKCSYCGKLFLQPCRLKEHVYTHIGLKPYKCDFQGCVWSFSTSSKLRRHQRKHTQNRKYQCKVCCKSFLRLEHLKDHNLKHFVKKTFVCQVKDCSTVFYNKSTMYAHLKKHRTQELKSEQETYPCPVENCYLVFTAADDLRAHLQNSHGPACGIVSFNSQEGLLVGMSDLVQCIPTSIGNQGDYSESNSSNIITHIVFTDDQPEVDRSADSEEQSPPLTETTNESDGQPQGSIGSARTSLTYQAALEGKHPTPTPTPTPGLHMASDVVLSAGLQDTMDRSLLLQDELTGADLYLGVQEESRLLGPSGELQVLLLDPASRLQHADFEQSTINLRDLE